MERTVITSPLRDIAGEHSLKILYACESGSRAWGFPSPDSDYDVRFIYVRPFNYYLSVMEREDQLSFPISDELDIYGWDIRKVLQLMRKSNTTPFEWLQSPIVYSEEEGFRNALWDLCPGYFSRRGNAFHYLGIAKGALDTMGSGNEIGIKKLFYVLRPLLAAKWCLTRDTIAPMTFAPLMTLLPEGLQQQVAGIIKLKETSSESFPVKMDSALKAFIEVEMTACAEIAKGLEKDNFKADDLDQFFRKTIAYYDHTRSEGPGADTP